METASKCDLCSKDFITRSELNHHMTREHEKPSCTRKKIFMCSMCDRALGSKEQLIYHVRTHTGERPFKCTVDDCGMAFKRESTLTDHIKCKHSDELPLKCRFPGCQYAGKTSTALSRHKKMHSDEKPFACSECNYKTNRNQDLQSHMNRHHSARRDFICGHPDCTKSFKSSVELKRHFSNRHEERNLKCDHPGCGSNFANATALNKHKRNVHSTEILVCPTSKCSYRTNTKGNLARHMKVHDGKNEKLSCSIEGCHFKGKNRRALERHMRLHQTLFPCPESGCGHYTATEEALTNHLKLHDSSRRLFECPLCFKYHSTLTELQKHCFAHTKEKPLQCGQCEYAAAFRSQVKRHISSAHEKVQFPFIVHLLDDRECLDCKVTLSTAEFLVHCEGHVDPVVMEPDCLSVTSKTG